MTGKKNPVSYTINLIDAAAVIAVVATISALYPHILKLAPRQRSTSAEIGTISKQNSAGSSENVYAKIEKVNVCVRFTRYAANIIRAVAAGDIDEETGSAITDILSVDPVTHDLIARVNAIIRVQGDMLVYRKEHLKLGSQFLFKTRKYDINGEVLFIDHPWFVFQPDALGFPNKEIGLRVRFSGYNREVIDAIREGDRDLRQPGTVVRSVASVKPMIRVTDNGSRYRDPYRMTVVVHILADVNYDGDLLYYRALPLKIGGSFMLKTGRYDMNGEVIGIDE